MKRLIFHVDVNSAFLSWEATKRVREGREDIRLIPSIIGGDRESRRGVVLAKSVPAKKYGIKTGEPVAAALRKCPQLYIAEVDHGLYESCSRAFADMCGKYAPVLEQFSVDECFLDMSGTALIYPDPIATAYELKNRIRDELGFTVNIGISDCKVLAKMASDFEKPDKVHTLFRNEIEEKMWPLPVGELFTVGAATAERLARVNIKTIGDLAKTDPATLRSILGDKLSDHLHRYANGIDESSVSGEPEQAKGYRVSTTLPRDITDMADAEKVLFELTDSVASRMRHEGAKTTCISVTVRSNDFKDRSHQRKLNVPTDITLEIFSVTKSLMAELWKSRVPLRLIGVALTGITRDEPIQIGLFDDEKREKDRRVDKTLDDIRHKFGMSSIMRASSYRSDHKVGEKYKARTEADSSEDE